MHLRTAHRWTTTHCGGHGAKSAHKNNVAHAPLGNKKDDPGLGKRMKIVSPQCGMQDTTNGVEEWSRSSVEESAES
jgi:hypothetical protein